MELNTGNDRWYNIGLLFDALDMPDDEQVAAAAFLVRHWPSLIRKVGKVWLVRGDGLGRLLRDHWELT